MLPVGLRAKSSLFPTSSDSANNLPNQAWVSDLLWAQGRCGWTGGRVIVRLGAELGGLQAGSSMLMVSITASQLELGELSSFRPFENFYSVLLGHLTTCWGSSQLCLESPSLWVLRGGGFWAGWSSGLICCSLQGDVQVAWGGKKRLARGCGELTWHIQTNNIVLSLSLVYIIAVASLGG